MARRIIRDADFMQYVMTPPPHELYDKNEPSISTVRVISNRKSDTGLGDVPVVGSVSDTRPDWVMPVVIIVVSAMALMTLYAVISKR